MEFLKIWEIILRRKKIVLIIFFIFFVSVVIITHVISPTYKAKSKVLVEASEARSALLSTLGIQTKSGTTSSTSETNYDTEIGMAELRPLLKELISSLGLKSRRGKPIRPEDLVEWSLINKIWPQPYVSVAQYEDSDILEIESTSSNPVEAANMSNQLAESYIKNRVRVTKEEYKAARIFIEDQIKAVKADYNKSLDELKDYKIKYQTIDLSVETQGLFTKLMTLRTTYEDNERNILELEKSMTTAEEKLKDINVFRKEAEEHTQSDQVKALKTKLNDLLTSVSEKSTDFTKEHPDYKKLEKQIETVKDLIKDEVKVIFNSERLGVDPEYDSLTKKLVENYIDKEVASAKRMLLKKYVDAYQNELLRIPEKMAGTSKIELALGVNKDAYQKLLGYLSQVNVAESMALANIKLVELSDVPDKRSFPKKLLNYALGVFLGLFWGLAVAFFLEYIDHTVKSSEDIKQFKSLTLLGTIPLTKHLKNKGIISSLDPSLPVIEAFRTIRNNVRYATVDKPIKSLAITSSIESEGKSSIAANLSMPYGIEGKKVILVDLDLRRPSINKFFNIPNSQKGITNIIVEGLQLEDAIVNSRFSGIDLLPSGPVPSDPGRIIEMQKLRDIINKLKETYDVVIIDTPPLMAVNDAVIIGTLADGILYIIESGKATLSMVEHAQELIAKANINLLGVVLNKSALYPHYYHFYNPYYKQ